jgi:alkylation response protein AidB-like acyl-CoA dehydrogenase
MNADVAVKSRTAEPSFDELKRTVNSLLPLVEAEADESERLYHQTDRLVDEFRRAGLYRLLVPKSLGGLELPYVEAMQLVERVAWADGSAGWCMMVEGVMGASAGSFLPDAGARQVYAKGGDVFVAGNGVPRGFARPVDGGYMIKGHWAYGSGIYHAEWIHSGCFVMDGDKMVMTAEGTPEIVLCHHPRSTIELKGNWDVLGLRGTGSFDYVTRDAELFVPSDTCFAFDAKAPARGGPQYSAGLVAFTSWGHTSWALGVGRRALDELAKHARGRTDVFGRLSDSPTFRKAFADAEARYRAARLRLRRLGGHEREFRARRARFARTACAHPHGDAPHPRRAVRHFHLRPQGVARRVAAAERAAALLPRHPSRHPAYPAGRRDHAGVR